MSDVTTKLNATSGVGVVVIVAVGGTAVDVSAGCGVLVRVAEGCELLVSDGAGDGDARIGVQAAVRRIRETKRYTGRFIT